MDVIKLFKCGIVQIEAKLIRGKQDMKRKTFLETNKQIDIIETVRGTLVLVHDYSGAYTRKWMNTNFLGWDFDDVVFLYKNNLLETTF